MYIYKITYVFFFKLTFLSYAYIYRNNIYVVKKSMQ